MQHECLPEYAVCSPFSVFARKSPRGMPGRGGGRRGAGALTAAARTGINLRYGDKKWSSNSLPVASFAPVNLAAVPLF
jgi:hypothetical protein